jgi:hypothetical protein
MNNRRMLISVGLFVLCATLIACGFGGSTRTISSDEPAEEPTVDTSAGYSLLIVKQGEEGEMSVLVINQSPYALPMAEFSMGNDRGEINGAALGVDALEAGACVAAWKARGNAEAPSGTECNLVADLGVSPPVFWGKDMDIEFAGEVVGTCGEGVLECSIHIGGE